MDNTERTVNFVGRQINKNVDQNCQMFTILAVTLFDIFPENNRNVLFKLNFHAC